MPALKTEDDTVNEDCEPPLGVCVQPPVGIPVKVGKPVTEISVAAPLVAPVKLMVTVEAVDNRLLLNAKEAA